MPRVQRLSEGLLHVWLLPYLRHLTELTTYCDDEDRRLGCKYTLPYSLRTLRLCTSPRFTLKPENAAASPHAALVRRHQEHATARRCTISVADIAAFDVHLRLAVGYPRERAAGQPATIELNEWKLPLSYIALPVSIIELNFRWLANYPLPFLPP